jgi:puromycin-sensitive aminopeptidase
MNSAELTISKAVWKDSTGKEQVASISLDEKAEIFRANFQTPLTPGNGTLFVEFSGSISDKMKGFYRSKSKGCDGKECYNAVTQFEATGKLLLFFKHVIYC